MYSSFFSFCFLSVVFQYFSYLNVKLIYCSSYLILCFWKMIAYVVIKKVTRAVGLKHSIRYCIECPFYFCQPFHFLSVALYELLGWVTLPYTFSLDSLSCLPCLSCHRPLYCMYRHLPMPSTYRININDSRKEGFLCGLVPEAIRKIRIFSCQCQCFFFGTG